MKNNPFVSDRICNFFSPSKIILGVAAAEQVGNEAKSLGGQKVLIITDPGVARVGLVEKIQEALISEKLIVGIFDRVELEPPARVIDECADLVRKEGYDLIVGLGGGSSLDTAKGVSVVGTNEGRVLDYVGIASCQPLYMHNLCYGKN